MNTTEVAITTEWQVLATEPNYLAFDNVEATKVEVFFSDSGAPAESVRGHIVQSWGAGFDFTVTGLVGTNTVVYVRGITKATSIRVLQ